MTLDIVYISYIQAPYVADAMHGILSQQVAEDVYVRVVIADDCSPDGTLEEIRKYESISPFPFVYLQAERNIGMLENYRRVFRAIEGDYVAILEGDDYWTDPLKIQKQIDYLEANPDYGLCYTDCDISGGRFGGTKDLFKSRGEWLNTNNPIHNTVYFANLTWLFRKEMVQYFQLPDYCTDIPLLMFYEMCLHTKVGHIEDTTGVFRVHGGSVSNNSGAKRCYFRKGFFLISEYYARQFPEVVRNLARVYTDGVIDGVYSQAKENGDEIIMAMFEKHFEGKLDIDHLLYVNSLTQRENQFCIEKAESEAKSARQSARYKIGNAFLTPWGKIKSLCKVKKV